jgi:NitT/TauT family transport system ATP-binding protein
VSFGLRFSNQKSEGSRTRREMASVPHIRIEGLSLQYRTKGGSVSALENVSVDIPPRSFVSVVGPSGCGKTTLLKVLSGVLKATSGSVSLDNAPIERTALSGKIGYVFQRPLLLPWRTALQNVLLTTEVARKNVPLAEREAEARQWLALTGLSGFEDRLPHELSGGMQQRVSLCRALALRPTILLMDEPFAALDEITREVMQEELLQLWSATESTVIFITHSISEAVLLSERVIVMTARPGRVDEIIDIPFARPRDEELRGRPEFAGLVQRIRSKLHRRKVPVGAES